MLENWQAHLVDYGISLSGFGGLYKDVDVGNGVYKRMGRSLRMSILLVGTVSDIQGAKQVSGCIKIWYEWLIWGSKE